jgi:transposase
LGIVSGLIDEIGIVEYINEKLGNDTREKVSTGVIVKAMLLNGLGFILAPLYMFEQFFIWIATEHLLGEGVKPEHLNDDWLEQVMDKLYEEGLSEVFLGISLQAVWKFGVEVATGNLDIQETTDQTWSSLWWIFCAGDGDVPVWLEMASGNQSDKAKFADIWQAFQKQWTFERLCVANAANI